MFSLNVALRVHIEFLPLFLILRYKFWQNDKKAPLLTHGRSLVNANRGQKYGSILTGKVDTQNQH